MSQMLPSAGKDPTGVRCLKWEPREGAACDSFLRQVRASSFLSASLLHGSHTERPRGHEAATSAAPSLGRRSVRVSCEFPNPGLSLSCLFFFCRERLSVEKRILSREVFFVVNSHLWIFFLGFFLGRGRDRKKHQCERGTCP